MIAIYLEGRALETSVDGEGIEDTPWLSVVIRGDEDDWPATIDLGDRTPPPHARGVLGINPVYRQADGDPRTLVFEWPSRWYAAENAQMQEWMPDRVALTAAQLHAIRRGDPAAPVLQPLIAQHVVIGLPRRFTRTLRRPARAHLRRRVRELRAALPI